MLRRIICVLLLCTSLIGCTSGGGSEESNATTTNNEEAKAEETKEEVTDEVNYDPLGKYEEPIKMTSILSFIPPDPGVKDGTTPENNSMVNAIKEDLNIDFEWLWTVPSAQYGQKFGVAMASQQLPDVFTVSSYDYQTLLENEQIQPWNEALKYASDELKDRIYSDPFPISTTTNENGDIMALPRYWEPARNLNVMMIRKDWLDEFGLEVPTTPEELEVVAQTFVDKKGIKAGISLSQWGIGTIMAMFGVYPGAWTEDENGNLIIGEGTPEAKEVLEILNGWYDSGIINKEYALATGDDVKEWIIQEELGIVMQPYHVAANWIDPALQKNKDSEWISAPMPKKEGLKGGAIIDKMLLNGAGGYWVINKDCKNPEAVVKMMNLFIDVTYSDEGLKENGFAWNYCPVSYYNPSVLTDDYKAVNREIEAGNLTTPPEELSAIDKESFLVIEEYTKWKNGEMEYPDDSRFSFPLAKFDKDFVMGTTVEVMDRGEYIENEFYGIPTELMKERMPTLNKLRDETFDKIIMGEAPLDSFDKYLKDWQNMGGTEVIEEVNEWYKDNKK